MELILEDIENAPRDQLKKLFEAEFGRIPPPRTSEAFMRQNLAWNFQAREAGLDPAKYRAKIIKRLIKLTKTTKSHQHHYRPGTRLVREWQGELYQVVILEDGYEWNGDQYRSLSQIATAITGTKWSGPRFFGLNGGASNAE